MDFFYWMLAIVALVGVVLIVASLIIGNTDESQTDEEQQSALLEYLNLNTKKRDIDLSITEADNVITELNDVSKTVFKEIDDKYQELLFLYNLIEDKKKTLSDTEKLQLPETEMYELPKAAKSSPSSHLSPKTKNAPINPFTFGKRSKVDIQVTDDMAKAYKNPKLVEINRLRNEGLDVAEIAKRLNMGQGEISLILALNSTSGKGR